MRPKERRETGQSDLLRSRLDAIIDMDHALVKLARTIDWGFLEERFGAVYSDKPGQPPLPTRLMAGLAILKYTHDLSDEVLCERWVENPYYQFFCGEEFFQHRLVEYLNSIVQNWHYILPHPISAFQYNLEASIDFSTVIPAVLSTAFIFYQVLKDRVSASYTRGVAVRRETMPGLLLFGIACLVLVWVAPGQAFPLVWIAPIFIIEPLLYLAGYPSLLREVQIGHWLPIQSIMIGTLFTGFWWECWNFFSIPKWSYTVPYVGFWKIFEMPLLGYLGYPFFGIIIFSFALLAAVLFFGPASPLTRGIALAFDLNVVRAD